MHSIDDLYEQKAFHLRHEAHVNALLTQLRAIIDEEKSHHGNGYVMDDHSIEHIQKPPDGF